MDRQKISGEGRRCNCAGLSKLDILLLDNVDDAAGRQAQGRNDRQRHERQRHERVDAAGHAQLKGALLRGLEMVVDLDEAVLAHEARDLQDELAEHGPVLHDGDAAAVLDDAVGRKGHVLLIRADDDDVV